MAFRDEQEALRQRAAALEREIGARCRERDEVQQAIADLQSEIELETGLARGGRGRYWVLFPILMACGIGLGIFLGGNGSRGAETIFGDVRRTSGSAPVPVGARCTLFVSPVTDEDASFNTDLQILCNGRIVYGGEGLGGVDCTKSDGRAVRCDDRGYTDQGKDPRMRFDRPAATVVIADRRPDYRIEIAFAPLPMGRP